MMKKFYSVTSLLFLMTICLLLASCGNKTGSMDIYLGGEVIEKEDKIIIEGESNLIEGSRVTGKIVVNEDEVISDTTELVDNKGKFKMELDHHQYGDAEIVVQFGFLNSHQDDNIVEHYGEVGEKLEGPFVYVEEHWDLERVNKKAEVRLPLLADEEESAHVLAAPKWQELPDDYGDPRVWIEVDDITEDDEYFYLNGRTNLIEGSRIKGWYSSSWGATEHSRVNPDGTFNLKIEYKYSEDPYFTIQYDPYASQWETVKEKYGHDGEKLVGNLVQTSNDHLFLEAIIDYEHE